MMIENTTKDKLKRFRIRSKKFFLTYPQIPNVANMKNQFLNSLESTFSYSKMKYVISEEKHKDGNSHIHVYLEFGSKQQISSREKLHVNVIGVEGEEYVCQGKYESVKSTSRVLEYITKHGEESDLLTNMDLPILDNKIY
jgi:hypothetical protein